VTTRTQSRPVAALAQLLEEQREALREGRLQDLANMVPRMERAIGTLGADEDPSAKESLRRLATENAVLLQAAQAGVAQARAMRAEAAGIRLSTYDAAGRRSDPAPGPGRILARR
jgi:hypothetical protein